MTDSTDLPSRRDIVERHRLAKVPAMLVIEGLLDSLTLLDLAAEMQRRGAHIVPPSATCPYWDVHFRDGPQQEDTAG